MGLIGIQSYSSVQVNPQLHTTFIRATAISVLSISDDDHDENVNYGNKKRRRFDEKSIMKRRNRRIWEDKRAKILFDYQQFSFVGPSTAVLMYELAWKMSRDDNDLLWWSIIGHTEQFVMLKSEDDKYLIGSGNLRDHVSRLNITTSSSSEGENSRSIGEKSNQ